MIENTKKAQNDTLLLNKTTADQLLQLKSIDSTTIPTIQDSLDFVKQELVKAGSELKILMNRLQSFDLTNTDVMEAEMKVNLMAEVVKQNDDLLATAARKMDMLDASSSELEEKYKQLKQHRDLLKQILDNIGKHPCSTPQE